MKSIADWNNFSEKDPRSYEREKGLRNPGVNGTRSLPFVACLFIILHSRVPGKEVATQSRSQFLALHNKLRKWWLYLKTNRRKN